MRRRGRRALWKPAVAALAVGIAAAAFFFLRPRSAPPAPPTAAPTAVPAGVIAPPSPRPVPSRLAAEHQQLHGLLRSGKYPEAAARSPAFLSELAREWGETSPDLATYHYDFALALKLSGRHRQALETARQAHRAWPASFQLEVLFFSTAAEVAAAERACPPEVEEGLRKVLRPENAPRLRGLRVDPAGLHALRGRLLEIAGKSAESLAAAEEGLRFDPRQAPLRELRARALVALERPAEAAPLLRELVAERNTPERQALLGTALLGCGKAEEALGIFSRLLADSAGRPDPARDRTLRLHAARALVDLGRKDEARAHLRDLVLEEPESIPALQLLASALGPPARDALHRRVRELLPVERSVREAQKAQAAGFQSSALYHRAHAALRLGRPGEALARLQEAVKLSPRLAPLRVELSRAEVFLGRGDLAERTLREGIALEVSPLLSAALAAVVAREGRADEARGLLAAGEGKAVPEPAAAAALADAWLELGDTARARASLAAASGEEAEEKPLLLAEAALREGKDAEARGLLEAGAGPGFFSALRERALRAALRLRQQPGPATEAGGEASDPSDLLDEPRLLPAGPAGGLREAAERLRKVRESLRAADPSGGYRQLFGLYSEVGARRKTREIAWLLSELNEGAEGLRLVARTLDRYEERPARLSVLRKARKSLPADSEIEEWWREGCAFLGWDPP